MVQKKQHLQPYEKLLKRFKYRMALGTALLVMLHVEVGKGVGFPAKRSCDTR